MTELNADQAKSIFLLHHDRLMCAFHSPKVTGFIVQKSWGDEWFFGRPKGGVYWWEKMALADLLHAGLQREHLDALVPLKLYKLSIDGLVQFLDDKVVSPSVDLHDFDDAPCYND